MVQIEKEKCSGCGVCIADCVAYNLYMEDGKACVKRDCIKCGHCVSLCPAEAVSIPEYDMNDVEACGNDKEEIAPKQLLHMIKARRSIRTYKECAIEKEKLTTIINAGRYTATAVNAQACHFVVVQDGLQELKESVWQGIDERLSQGNKEMQKEWIPYMGFLKRVKENPASDYLFRNAPVVVFITSGYPLDAGLAAQNMELTAVAEGLGMLYNGYLARAVNADERVKSWLSIQGEEVRACMLLGYPDVSYLRTAPRREANVTFK